MSKCTQGEKRQQIFFQKFHIALQLFVSSLRLTEKHKIKFLSGKYDTIKEY